MRFHSGMEEEDKRTVYGQPCVLQQVAPVLASLSLDMVPDRAHLICGWINYYLFLTPPPKHYIYMIWLIFTEKIISRGRHLNWFFSLFFLCYAPFVSVCFILFVYLCTKKRKKTLNTKAAVNLRFFPQRGRKCSIICLTS